MKLKLLLSIMAVSLFTVSASGHESDEQLEDGRNSPLGSSAVTAARQRQAEGANSSQNGTPTKEKAKSAKTATKGGVLAKVRSVFTMPNAKSGLIVAGKTAVGAAGAAISADAYALATTGVAHGCSSLFGTNVATFVATGLTTVPMVSLPAGAVVVGGIVFLPTAAVAVNLMNQFLPEKLKFKKTEKALKGWAAWGVNAFLIAGTVGLMQYPMANLLSSSKNDGADPLSSNAGAPREL